MAHWTDDEMDISDYTVNRALTQGPFRKLGVDWIPTEDLEAKNAIGRGAERVSHEARLEDEDDDEVGKNRKKEEIAGVDDEDDDDLTEEERQAELARLEHNKNFNYDDDDYEEYVRAAKEWDDEGLKALSIPEPPSGWIAPGVLRKSRIRYAYQTDKSEGNEDTIEKYNRLLMNEALEDPVYDNTGKMITPGRPHFDTPRLTQAEENWINEGTSNWRKYTEALRSGYTPSNVDTSHMLEEVYHEAFGPDGPYQRIVEVRPYDKYQDIDPLEEDIQRILEKYTKEMGDSEAKKGGGLMSKATSIGGRSAAAEKQKGEADRAVVDAFKQSADVNKKDSPSQDKKEHGQAVRAVKEADKQLDQSDAKELDDLFKSVGL